MSLKYLPFIIKDCSREVVSKPCLFSIIVQYRFTNGRSEAARPGWKCHENVPSRPQTFCGLSGVTPSYSVLRINFSQYP